MKTSDRNWIAGIMDKGCGITGFVARNDMPYLRVTMSSTNAEMAMKLHGLIKTGTIQIRKRAWTMRAHGINARTSKIKDVYCYMLNGEAASDFLFDMLPYLRTERTFKRAFIGMQLHEDKTRRTLRKLRALGTRTIKS